MSATKALRLILLVGMILGYALLGACRGQADTAVPAPAPPAPVAVDIGDRPLLALVYGPDSPQVLTVYVGQPEMHPLYMPAGAYYLEAIDGDGRVYEGRVVQIEAAAGEKQAVLFDGAGLTDEPGAAAAELQTMAEFILSVKLAEFAYLETVSQGFQSPLGPDLTGVDVTAFHDGLDGLAAEGAAAQTAFTAFAERAGGLLAQATLLEPAAKPPGLARPAPRPRLGVWDKLASFVGLSGELDDRYKQEMLDVSAQMTPEQKADTFFWLTEYERKGAENYDEFLQLLAGGELDDRNIKIIYNRVNNSEHYQGIYQTLHPESNRPGGEAIHHAGSELIKKGAELEVEVIKAVLTGAFPEMTTGFEYADKANEWVEFVRNMYEQPLATVQEMVGQALIDKLQENIQLDLQSVMEDLDDETAAALAQELTDEIVALGGELATRVAQGPTATPENGTPSGDEPTPAPTSAPTAEPEVEGTSAVPLQVMFKAPVEGVTVSAYDHYNVGSTSELVNMPDPYIYVKPGVCGMETDVTTMPAAALPGTTPLEALTEIYARDYATEDSSRTWTQQEEPYELTVQGEPAARLLATSYNPSWDKTTWILLTVIRGATRAALVEGVMSDNCADNPNILADLTQTADSVTLADPEPVCYVATMAGSDPVEYGLACDGLLGPGPEKLANADFTDVVLGPVTWDECAAFMREHGQDRLVRWVTVCK